MHLAISLTRPQEAEVRVLDAGPADGALVQRALDSDEWATEVLYRRYHGVATQTATRLLRNRAEAEDVVQDAFLHALSRLGQLREGDAFRGWFLRIVVSMAHRRLRRAFFRRRVDAVDGFESEAASTASPETRAELRLLDRTLSKAPPDERIAWTLRYVLGMKLEEVAAACACSLATAKRRIAATQKRIGSHVHLEGVDD